MKNGEREHNNSNNKKARKKIFTEFNKEMHNEKNDECD